VIGFANYIRLTIYPQVMDPKIIMSQADSFVKKFVQILALVWLAHVCSMALIADPGVSFLVTNVGVMSGRSPQVFNELRSSSGQGLPSI
jgi:hypothetical protein